MKSQRENFDIFPEEVIMLSIELRPSYVSSNRSAAFSSPMLDDRFNEVKEGAL